MVSLLGKINHSADMVSVASRQATAGNIADSAVRRSVDNCNQLFTKFIIRRDAYFGGSNDSTESLTSSNNSMPTPTHHQTTWDQIAGDLVPLTINAS